jgi:hypothetical protein
MSRPEPARLGFGVPTKFIEPESAVLSLENINTPVALEGFN